MPSVTLLMLDLFPTMRGMASSLQGFVQFSLSAVVAGTIAPFLVRSLKTLALGMLASATASFALWLVYQRRTQSPPQGMAAMNHRDSCRHSRIDTRRRCGRYSGAAAGNAQGRRWKPAATKPAAPAPVPPARDRAHAVAADDPADDRQHKLVGRSRRDADERSTGLMHRFSLKPDHGMMFVFERASRRVSG